MESDPPICFCLISSTMLGRLSKDSPSVQPFCSHMRENAKTFFNVCCDLLSEPVLPGSGYAQRSAMHAKSLVSLPSTDAARPRCIPLEQMNRNAWGGSWSPTDAGQLLTSMAKLYGAGASRARALKDALKRLSNRQTGSTNFRIWVTRARVNQQFL